MTVVEGDQKKMKSKCVKKRSQTDRISKIVAIFSLDFRVPIYSTSVFQVATVLTD